MSDVIDLIEQLCSYIDTPSISGSETAYLKLLEKDFKERGYRTERQPVSDDRWNLVALPKNDAKLLFSTHVDVVPPHIPSKVEYGRVFGRGACDTKGGLVAMMAAADELDPDREWIGFLLVVGEEVDHIGAECAKDLELRPEAIVLCEPTTLKLVTGQKGILKVRVSTRGVAAHSAYPELGVDAIGPLLDTLQKLRTADYPSHETLGETTLNIGLIEGGVAANVVPPSASAELFYRVVSDVDELLEQVRDICANDADVEPISQNSPVEPTTVSGFDTEVIAFNTDVGYLTALGPVYLVGPGDIRFAHGDKEHIAISDLNEGTKQYVRLVNTIFNSQ